MFSSQFPGTTAQRVRSSAVAAVVIGAASIGLSACGANPASSAPRAAAAPPRSAAVPMDAPGTLASRRQAALGTADGEVPDDVTVFDDGYPAVSKLDPSLLTALRSAATAAEDDGIEFYVNSGWRSYRYQEQLFEQAVSTYRSETSAAKWVARPGTSVHEAGEAVDLGPSDADDWLSQHGAAYGLCQIYANEPWHYELRPDAVDHGCPTMYADPTDDPRLQQ